MVKALKSSIILDSCVLIDYLNAEEQILSKIAKNIGQVIIPLHVFEEVKQFNKKDCKKYDLFLYKPKIECVLRAGQIRNDYKSLSFCDLLCMLIAFNEKFILYTNDKKLRNNAIKYGVNVKWGLSILIDLVKLKTLHPNKAIKIASQICDNFPFSQDKTKKIFEEFKIQINSIT